MKGSVFKRGSTWYFVVDVGRDPVTGKRKQKWKGGFRTKKEAEKACAELIAQIEAGKYKEPATVTLESFLLEFMEGEKHRIRETTWNNQMFLVQKHILPALGHVQLKDLSPLHLQKFYTQKASEGLSNSYLRSMYAVLSKTLRAAERWGLIEKNTAALVSPPRPQKREMRVWTLGEVRQFLQASEKRKFYIAYVLAVFTGMRRGEILGLRWSDIDLEKGVIHVQRTLYKTKGKLVFQEPKTRGSKRSIVISPIVISALKKHRVRQQEMRLKLGQAYIDHDLVVCSWNGNPVDPSDLNEDFKMAIKKAGVPQIRFHDLRHTHATILLQLGEHPKVVSERLGHSSVTITLDTYSHVLPDMQRALAENLEAAMKNLAEKGC